MRKNKPRLVFEGTQQATLNSFATVWLVDPAEEADYALTDKHGEHNHGSLFAKDAYIRKEYVEIYDLIKDRKKEIGEESVKALVRGSSGIGKSAFLRYLLARIREEGVNNVLVVVQGGLFKAGPEFLHLTTENGKKIVRRLQDYWMASRTEEICDWTIVDGCDWVVKTNNFICAASPSTRLSKIKKTGGFITLCMPPWSLDQLQECARLTNNGGRNNEKDDDIIEEKYNIAGGIARYVFLKHTDDVIQVVRSAVDDIDFSYGVAHLMQTQTTSDVILWNVPEGAYTVTVDNPIQYSFISRYVAKLLAEKAALLTREDRRALLCQLR
jgi:hypothetical protein